MKENEANEVHETSINTALSDSTQNMHNACCFQQPVPPGFDSLNAPLKHLVSVTNANLKISVMSSHKKRVFLNSLSNKLPADLLSIKSYQAIIML